MIAISGEIVDRVDIMVDIGDDARLVRHEVIQALIEHHQAADKDCRQGCQEQRLERGPRNKLSVIR